MNPCFSFSKEPLLKVKILCLSLWAQKIMKIIDLINQPSIDNSLKIGYLGQSGYVLKKNDYTILIDPYLSNYIEDPNGLNR